MCLLVNAPTVFQFLWRVIKPWLAPRTTSKILFVGGKDYKEKMLHFFSKDQLPTVMGGENTITPQAYINDKLGAAPHAEKKRGWFSWGKSSGPIEGGSGVPAAAFDADPPPEDLPTHIENIDPQNEKQAMSGLNQTELAKEFGHV